MISDLNAKVGNVLIKDVTAKHGESEINQNDDSL